MSPPDEKTATLVLPKGRWPQARGTAFLLTPERSLSARRWFNFAEITIISVIYFWMAWIITPLLVTAGLLFFPLFITLLTVIYVAYVAPVVIHRESLAYRGLGPPAKLFIRTDNLGQAGLIFGLCTGGGILLLLLGGYFWGCGPTFVASGAIFLLRLAIYFISAFFQDGLFFSFFLRRWLTIYGAAPGRHMAGQQVRSGDAAPDPGRLWLAIGSNALLFSLYHLPNAPVMGLALVLGLVWGRVFIPFPNLLAAALGHALLGTVLHLHLNVSTKVASAYYLGHTSFYAVLCPLVEHLIDGRF